jgi:NosR/NirI family nitrous oxide reductase transcriptional regulator
VRRIACALAALLLGLAFCAGAQDRFPRPEFGSGYALPQIQTPAPRADVWLYVDVAILALAIGASILLVLKLRSRIGVVALSAASLAYFGFIRRGCICAVGSIQNVTQAVFDPSYALAIPVAAFFILPILGALIAGRTYCAGVCPFGALQDLVHLRTLRVPSWLDRALSAVPYLYLGFAVLCAATGIGYLICRFDPFVGFFRLSMSLPMAIFSAAVLVSSIFIGRPYCRWLCPYGAVLSAASSLSRRHATISPAECVDCRLCEASCPVDAILLPVERPRESEVSRLRAGVKRSIILLPAILAAGGLVGYFSSRLLAPLHPDVALLLQLQRETELNRGETRESAAFLASGTPLSDLEAKVKSATGSITLGSALFGAYAAAVFGLFSISLYRVRREEGYRIHQGRCVSCARCFDYCPVERKKAGG